MKNKAKIRSAPNIKKTIKNMYVFDLVTTF